MGRRRNSSRVCFSVPWTVLACLAAVGCLGQSRGPGRTVEEFLAATTRCDTRVIEGLLPQSQLDHIRDSERRITALSSVSVSGGYSVVADLLCSGKGPLDVKIDKESVTGDRALVHAVVAGRTEDIPLVRDAGRWKLDLLGFLGTAGRE